MDFVIFVDTLVDLVIYLASQKKDRKIRAKGDNLRLSKTKYDKIGLIKIINLVDHQSPMYGVYNDDQNDRSNYQSSYNQNS